MAPGGGSLTFTTPVLAAGSYLLKVLNVNTGYEYLPGQHFRVVDQLSMGGLVYQAEGASQSVVVRTIGHDGLPDPGYRGTVHFTSSDPHATLPADYTFTAADAGSHTFTLKLATTGAQSVTVADATFPAFASTQTVPVGPARFKVNALGAAIAGVPTVVIVAAVNLDGSTITGYTGAVHFTSSDALAGLPADYTFVAADSGSHPFLVTFRTPAAAQTVTVTDVNGPPLGSAGAISGASNPVRVIRLPRGIANGTGVVINQGQPLQLLGTALANAVIKIIIHSVPVEIDTTADAAGNWSVSFDTSQIDWGDHTIYYEELDPNGIDSGQLAVSALHILDVTPPASTLSRSPAPNAAGWSNGAVTLTVTAVDQPHGSQVQAIHLVLDGTDHIFAATTATITISADLRHSVSFWSVDNAGNVEGARSVPVWVDQTPPSTIASVSGPAGSNGWFKAGSAVRLILAATDNLAGVATTYYASNGGSTVTYGGPVTFGDGVFSVRYWSIDAAGNLEAAHTVAFKVDQSPPTVTIGGVSNGATYLLHRVPTPTFTATDAPSGIARSSATLSSPGTASGAGKYTYTATATDMAGNTTVATVVYYVVYRWGGFTTPNQGDSFNPGDNIPIKFTLGDADYLAVSNATAYLVVDGTAVAGANFVWNGSRYIYTLNSTGLSAGPHILQVNLDDGTVHQAVIFITGARLSVGSATLSTQMVAIGSSLTISGGGFAPGSTVSLYLGSQLLGTTTANASGIASLTIAISAGTAPGTYVIALRGPGQTAGVTRLVGSTTLTITS